VIIQDLTARDVARYFLANVDEESGDNITNLKLQKLLYYAQGFHLAMRGGDPLFPEKVLAWPHGPVVKSVWLQYKPCSFNPIAIPADFQEDEYLPEIQEILDAVYSTYGQFSAKKLEQMTHEESPWMNTPRMRVISLSSIESYFSGMVEAGRKGESAPGRPIWPTNSFRFQRRREIAAGMAPLSERFKTVLAQRRLHVG